MTEQPVAASADGSVDNSRYATVRFQAVADGLVHGIAGYFESRLFEEVQLSTGMQARRGRTGAAATDGGRSLEIRAATAWPATRHSAQHAHARDVQLVSDLFPVHGRRARSGARALVGTPLADRVDGRRLRGAGMGADAAVCAPGGAAGRERVAQEQRHQGQRAHAAGPARTWLTVGCILALAPWIEAGAGAQVWYEWCAMGETSTRLQNPDGRSYFIGL